VALVSLVALSPVWAEDAATSLTLSEFSELVDRGLPETALVRAGVLDAEAELERASQLPELGVTFERQEVGGLGDGQVLQSSVALDWSFDLSGRRGLRIDAASANLRAIRLRGERARTLIATRATATYLRAARARLRLESLSQTRGPLARLTESLKRRAAAGDVSGADFARFELALSEHDDRIAAARAELAVAETRLAALLGRSGRVAASDDLALPAAPADSRADRPDVRAADEDLSGGRALVRAASRWWIPTVELSAGYLSTDSGAEVERGYLAVLSLSVPIFSRGQAERKRGEARAARARATKTILERRVSAEIESAMALLSSNLERARAHQQRRLVLAAELVEKTRAAYTGGEATALELRDAYEKATDARLRAVDLRLEARLAELELARARGASR
jgi:cobalt-zinc-cadmium efflux system outer membrane protein